MNDKQIDEAVERKRFDTWLNKVHKRTSRFDERQYRDMWEAWCAALERQRVPEEFRNLTVLVSELCHRIDCDAEDVGTYDRPVDELLPLIGAAVDRAEALLAAAPEPEEG